jgi:uncharacterized membrane protein YhaH (DUF805 family)
MTAPYDPREGQHAARTPGEDIPRQEPPSYEDPQGLGGPENQYAPQASYTPYPQGTDPGYASGSSFTGDARFTRGADQRSYLGGGRAGFSAAVSQGLANLLTFRGRASRSAYWWFLLFTILVQAALDLVVSAASHGSHSVTNGTLTLVSTVLTLALTVRRLHDSNRTGWWWLIGWVPVVGWLILLVFMLLPGTRGPNRFDAAR